MSGKEWIDKLKACRKDRAVILLLTGVLLLILAFPAKSGDSEDAEEDLLSGILGQGQTGQESAATVSADAGGENGAQQESGSLSGQSAIEAQLEERLAEILSRVEGIGDVEVMITLKSSGKIQVEKDVGQTTSQEDSQQESGSSSSSQTSDSESTVFQKDADGGESPYVTEICAPEIQGVLVIAQGADSSAVVSEITEAVMALFGTEAHKIKVMKME